MNRRYRCQSLVLAALTGAMVMWLLAACTVSPVGEVFTPAASLPAAGQIQPTDTPITEMTPTPLASEAPVLVATGSPAAAETATPGVYVVQAGDTLLGLATEWGVPMAAVQRLNGMGDSTVVMVGLTLMVPSAEGWEGASRYWSLYVIKQGETLSQIAQRFGLGIADILEANHMADADHIVAGQELVLPLEAPAGNAPDSVATLVPAPPTPQPVTAPEAPATATAAQDLGQAPAVTPTAVLVTTGLPADIADWPRETVRIINEIRAQHGLPPYAYNETLELAAQLHANDCAQRGWCSHTGSDGSNIKTRVQRVGYTGVGWAECWAQRQTPQGAVDIWMDEVAPNDPHRQMMLHTWFTEVGVGIVETTWGYYFIADFGRP